MASRLSWIPRNRLLLEAGGLGRNLQYKISVGYPSCIWPARTGRTFTTKAEPGPNDRSPGEPRGRAIGGSSSIDGMIHLRGRTRDFGLWLQMGRIATREKVVCTGATGAPHLLEFPGTVRGRAVLALEYARHGSGPMLPGAFSPSRSGLQDAKAKPIVPTAQWRRT